MSLEPTPRQTGRRGKPAMPGMLVWHRRAPLPVPEAPSRIITADKTHHCPKVKWDLHFLHKQTKDIGKSKTYECFRTDTSREGQSWAFSPRVKQVSMLILNLLQLVTDQPKQEQLLHISTLSFTPSFLTVLWKDAGQDKSAPAVLQHPGTPGSLPRGAGVKKPTSEAVWGKRQEGTYG